MLFKVSECVPPDSWGCVNILSRLRIIGSNGCSDKGIHIREMVTPGS